MDKPKLMLAIGKLKPKAGGEGEDDEAPPDSREGLNASAGDLLKAIKANDARGIAFAIEDMFMQLESRPHDEGGGE